MIKKLLPVTAILYFLILFAGDSKADLVQIMDENIWILIDGPKDDVPILVTDSKGQKFGYDPRTKEFFKDIPGGYDGAAGMLSEISDEYRNDVQFNIEPGEYTIQTIGKVLEKFSIYITIHRAHGSEGFDFQGITDKGSVTTFKVTYNGPNAEKVGTAIRVATPSSLKQDIILSHKVGWIYNDGVMKSLLKKAEAIEASIKKGNKEAAGNQIKAFINEVRAQQGKNIASYTDDPGYVQHGPDLVRVLNESDAVKILLDDAQYLMDHL